VARPKKPKASQKPKKKKLETLPEQVRNAIEAKQAREGGTQGRNQGGARNTGYAGGAPKRTGGRDR